jgi:ERCC4-type nuclease
VHELLTQVRRISSNNAKELLRRYGSLQKIVTSKNYDEFVEIEGIAKAKVDALNQCFKG